MPGPGFAVIDFETTGLFPAKHDRVVEIAVVHVDPDGRIGERWDTLVNPERDLGPQQIHRISASEVLEAPTFAQIAPRLVELLAGRVIVAHNASFDIRFLEAELERAGYNAWIQLETLCTMQLAREFLPGSGRSLQDCCDAFDIQVEGAHRASVDALATAELLECYLLHNPMWDGWAVSLERANVSWPLFAGESVAWCPRGTQRDDPRTFLQRITIKLPDHTGPAEQHDYLALLDRCLLDRDISVHEANALVELAESLGISRTTCVELHLQYFEALVGVAWADGVLTTEETEDLAAVAQLLGVPDEVVVEAMKARSAMPVQSLELFALEPGDLIVLTGDMRRLRAEWQTDIRAHGYVPWEAVTKKVRLVAAADPDSLSGKARKARDYGIAVVDEDGLARLLNDA
jgi:DNA polymerase-3 subunit epsilon